MFEKTKTVVKKARLALATAFTAEVHQNQLATGHPQKRERGISVSSFGSLSRQHGRDKQGLSRTEYFELPRFILRPEERFEVYQLQSHIQGIINGRMNKVGGLDFRVIPKKKIEDELVFKLRTMKQIAEDYENSGLPKYQIAAAMLRQQIAKQLPTVLPDLSNFDRALVRFRRKIMFSRTEEGGRIEDFLQKPNPTERWEDWAKKYVQDMLLHGGVAVYKYKENGQDINSLHILPGGTVFPVQTPYVSNLSAYIQMIVGVEAQLMNNDELAYDTYIPTSMSAYGMVPLDSLVTKIVEIFGQDEYWSNRADGSELPKTVLAFGKNADPKEVGALNEIGDEMEFDDAEQDRIEHKLSEMRRGAISVISGVGTPQAINLSQDQIAGDQLNRRIELKKEINQAFNASNIENNDIEPGHLGGKGIGEAQDKIVMQNAIYPLVRSLQGTMTHDVLPFLPFEGSHLYQLSIQMGMSDAEEIRMFTEKLNSRLFATNEIRSEMGEEPFPEPQYDRPIDAGPAQQQIINNGEGNA